MLTRDNAKHLAAILTALAGLATAVKSCSDSAAQAELVATRKVYSVIAGRIAKQDEQIQKLHDDDVALRAYVEGFKEAVQTTHGGAEVARGAAPPPVAPVVAAAPLAPAAGRPAVAMRRPPHVSRAPASDGDGMPDAVQVLPPPPPPMAAPRFDQLPKFDSL